MREVEADPAAKVAWEVQQAARKVRKAAKAAQQADKADQVQPCCKRSMRRCQAAGLQPAQSSLPAAAEGLLQVSAAWGYGPASNPAHSWRLPQQFVPDRVSHNERQQARRDALWQGEPATCHDCLS